MIGFPNTPAAIIINESLDIARRYAAPESIAFLNGVLDAIARDSSSKHVSPSVLPRNQFALER